MWGQTYFGGLVKDTIYGGLTKLGWAVYILKYHNHFFINRIFDFSNIYQVPRASFLLGYRYHICNLHHL